MEVVKVWRYLDMVYEAMESKQCDMSVPKMTPEL